MSKNGDVVRAQEAIRQLMTADPVDMRNVEALGAVLAVCGYSVLLSEDLTKLYKCRNELEAQPPAPTPWPFPLLAGVVIDGAIEAKVISHEFDGSFKTKCSYWFHGQMFEVWVASDRLSSPT